MSKIVKKLSDKCECGSSLVLRKNRTEGNFFLGCSAFPECKNTYSVSESEIKDNLEVVKSDSKFISECPFCGSSANYKITRKEISIICSKCKAQSETLRITNSKKCEAEKQSLRSKWNTRVVIKCKPIANDCKDKDNKPVQSKSSAVKINYDTMSEEELNQALPF